MLVFFKTVEAERISVDHVAHLKPSDGGSAATQCEISCLATLHDLTNFMYLESQFFIVFCHNNHFMDKIKNTDIGSLSSGCTSYWYT